MLKPKVSDRKAVGQLYKLMKLADPNLQSELPRADFDMFREFTLCSLEAAAGFCFIEHLLRTTTPYDEVQLAAETLPARLSQLVLQLSKQQISPYDRLKFLLSHLDWSDLGSWQAPMSVELYRLSSIGLDIEVFSPKEDQDYPICYILQMQMKICCLYTSSMTLVDCFNPYTGQRTEPYLTEQMMENIRRMLYRQNKTRTFAVQTDLHEESSLEKSWDSMHLQLKFAQHSFEFDSDYVMPSPPAELDHPPLEGRGKRQEVVAKPTYKERSSPFEVAQFVLSPLEESDRPPSPMNTAFTEAPAKKPQVIAKPTPKARPSLFEVVQSEMKEDINMPELQTWEQYSRSLTVKRREGCTELSDCQVL
jgi:hypothetical protein